jgi:hypothetical protein
VGVDAMRGLPPGMWLAGKCEFVKSNIYVNYRPLIWHSMIFSEV